MINSKSPIIRWFFFISFSTAQTSDQWPHKVFMLTVSPSDTLVWFSFDWRPNGIFVLSYVELHWNSSAYFPGSAGFPFVTIINIYQSLMKTCKRTMTLEFNANVDACSPPRFFQFLSNAGQSQFPTSGPSETIIVLYSDIFRILLYHSMNEVLYLLNFNFTVYGYSNAELIRYHSTLSMKCL